VPGGQLGCFRCGRNTAGYTVAKLFKFCIDTPCQGFSIAKQAPTGGNFQQQTIALRDNTYLAAVLVTPAGKALQTGLFIQFRKVQGQPLGLFAGVGICGHESSVSVPVLHS